MSPLGRGTAAGVLLASTLLSLQLPGCGADGGQTLGTTSGTGPGAGPSAAPTTPTATPTAPAPPGQRQWVRSWCGDGTECWAQKLTSAPGGDVLMIGQDAPPDVLSPSRVVACFSPEGERRWTTWLHPSIAVRATVAIDDGWIIAGGMGSALGKTVPFGSVAVTVQGSADGFLARLSHDGQFVWVRRFGDDAVGTPCTTEAFNDGWAVTEEVTGMARDADGALLIAGTLHGDADLLGQTVHGAGKHDGFVARVSVEGELLAHRLLGGPGDDKISDFALASDGTWAVMQTPGDLLTRLAPDGTVLWSSKTPILRFALAPDGDTITLRTEPTLAHLHVERLDPAGNVRWTRSFGDGPSGEAALPETMGTSALGVDASGNVVLATSFCDLSGSCQVRFGDVVFTDVAGPDLVVLELDPAGNQRWARQIKVPWSIDVNAVELRPDGIFVGGGYTAGFDWDGAVVHGEQGFHGFLARLAR